MERREDQHYDSDNDRIKTTVSETDAIKYARFVAIPSLGVIAVEDRSSDANIPANSALSRMRTIVKRGIQKGNFYFEMGATIQDIEDALTDWELDVVSFTVRPFNPHPSDPGRQLHSIMEADNISRLTATAKPKPDQAIKSSDEGLVREAVGLVKEGYGQIGIEGRDKAGRRLKVKKLPFIDDRNRSLERLRKRMPLRVMIDPNEDSSETELEDVADALIAMYAKR
jgi:hypothetical protein